jgi:hypothetical protein
VNVAAYYAPQPTPGEPSRLKASVCGPARLNAESLDRQKRVAAIDL